MAMRYDAGAAAYDQLTGRWSQLYADAALAAVKSQPGDKLLDLATGTADAAVLASQVLGSASTVVGADLSVPMLRVASEKPGAAHVFLVAADAMCLPFPDQSFRCVTCLFGLMFFPRPVTALRELRRVLAPRGRAALTMWSRPERAPFAGIMAEALAVELPQDAIEILKPFSVSDPETVRSHMEEAGFHDIQVTPLTRFGSFASVEEYLDPYERGGGRLGQFYLSLKDGARERVNARVRSRLQSGSSAERINLQIDALLASGAA
jgi:ubiquinone/menaquinone biosynthesis C-methylase UbiE